MHDISEVMVGGRRIVEAMYANNPAWHRLGTVFDPDGTQAPDSATAIRLAHLDWQVDIESLFLKDGREIADDFATVRQDTRTKLGIVGNRYNVLQNVDAFKFLDSLCQDGIIRYESAFALGGGRRIALLARMPEVVDEIAEGDMSMRYVLLYNSHDGSSQLTFTPTSVRVVCANTVRIALANKTYSVSLRHTDSMEDRMEEAKKYLSQFNSGFTLFRDHARLLAQRKVSKEDAKAYMEVLFPSPKSDASDTVKRHHEEKLEVLRGIMRQPKNQLPSIVGSWWSLVNTVTQWVDHSGKYRGKPTEIAERRFLMTSDGVKADFKNRAFELASSMAGVTSLSSAA